MIKKFSYIYFLASFFIFSYSAPAFSNNEDVKIVKITPHGSEIGQAHQIAIHFNKAIVPLGKMDRSADQIPVKIEPALNCQWRWLNRQTLACQLDGKEGLKLATTYKIQIDKSISSESGKELEKNYSHDFSTTRPIAEYIGFEEWKSKTRPSLKIYFNQAVSKKSVENHLYFLANKKRKALKAEAFIYPSDKDKDPIYVVSEKDGSKSEAYKIWIVEPKSDFNADTTVELAIEPGLHSIHGPLKGNENKVLKTLHTFPDFKFLGLNCTTIDDKQISFTKENDYKLYKCDPLKPVKLVFSTPVLSKDIQDNILITPNPLKNIKRDKIWYSYSDQYFRDLIHEKGKTYTVSIPARLKAVEGYSVQTRAVKGLFKRFKNAIFKGPKTDLKDAFGTYLNDPIDLKFSTNHRRPNLKLTHDTIILEKEVDSKAPIYTTNLDELKINYNIYSEDKNLKDQTHIIDLPDVKDIQFAHPLELRKILSGKSGVLYGKIQSTPQTTKKENNPSFFAQVTPYKVHLKLGHYNSLLWVTDLKTGQPIPNATVILYKDRIDQLNNDKNILSEFKTDENGIGLFEGSIQLDPENKTFGWNCSHKDSCEKLFAKVTSEKGIAFLPLDNRFSIDSYRVSDYNIWNVNENEYGHISAWGMTAQGIYKIGDQIDYKIYVRNEDNKSLIPAPQSSYTLTLKDAFGKVVQEQKDIKLNEFGSFHGSYTIAKNGSVGWYQFILSSSFTDEEWFPLEFLVSDFKPSPFKVSNELNGDSFKPGDKIDIQTFAKFHSGGSYNNAHSRVTAKLEAKNFYSDHPVAKDFIFDSYDEYLYSTLFETEKKLNNRGEFFTSFKLEPQKIFHGKVTVESAVRDDRGRYITGLNSAHYYGVDRFVGLKRTKWLYPKDKPAQIDFLVVKENGFPISGSDVSIEIEKKETSVARVKSSGNAYINKYTTEWKPVSTCTGTSKDTPSSCQFTPKESGTYRFAAKTTDTSGIEHKTSLNIWVTGDDAIVWEERNDNSLQIIPESKNYKVGTQARYLIKNPYPGAKALVTIERYGILKSWVQDLEGSSPVIEFKVEEEYLPGFYLSVVAFSPRVSDLPIEKNVDLGKPSFKMGYVKVPITDDVKKLKLDIRPDKVLYKPGETVKLSLYAQDKKSLSNKVEVALAVLDESVFDLLKKGKSAFDPYQGFYDLDDLDIRNYNLLTQLVGRRNFAKKGANAGGGGDALESARSSDPRSVFKYVSYFNPSIILDEDYHAQIDFTLPDNLTGWRILALAVTPEDKMGLSDKIIKVNRPTEIRPALPNHVFEGDNFDASFTVMNRTDQARDLDVILKASGTLNDQTIDHLLTQKISLKPFERKSISIPLQTGLVNYKSGQESGIINFDITAEDSLDRDQIVTSLKVMKKRSLDVAATYGTSVNKTVKEDVQIPHDIHTDIGGLSLSLSPTIINNLEGAFSYIKDYPFSCWEQKLTKALMAAYYQQLKPYLSSDFSWDKSVSLPNEIINEAINFQAPNGGMSFFTPQDQYVSPYLSAFTAIGFNWLKELGYKVPSLIEEQLHSYLSSYLKDEKTGDYYSKQMVSTVRAVILYALSEQNKLSLSDINRFKNSYNQMSLFGKSFYLQAALNINGAEKLASEVQENILGYSQHTSGAIQFIEEKDSNFFHILSSQGRTNCAVLSAFINSEEKKLPLSIQDVSPKLSRTIIKARKRKPHWLNTQENVFCMKALNDYANLYEKSVPKMTVKASLNSQQMGRASFKDVTSPPVLLNYNYKSTDPGQSKTMLLSKSGSGRYYYKAQLDYALKQENKISVNSGIDIKKEYSVKRNKKWQLITDDMKIKKGDLIKTDLFIHIPNDRYYVVVNDPIFGGIEPLNTDLATTSSIDTENEETQIDQSSYYYSRKNWIPFYSSRWGFYHKEVRHDALRYYSDYLSKGDYHLSYLSQAVASGTFSYLPAHAEEMYEPETYGKSSQGKIIIKKLDD